MPNSVTYINRTPTFKWCVVRCGFKEQTPNTLVFRREQTKCSKFTNHSRHNSQHIWAICDHFIIRRIFTLTIFMRAPPIMRKVALARFGFANHLPLITCFIPWRNGLVEKVTIQHQPTLHCPQFHTKKDMGNSPGMSISGMTRTPRTRPNSTTMATSSLE